MPDLTEQITRRLDELDWWATEASRDRRGEGTVPEAGAHWHWVDYENDQPINVDPVVDETLYGALRSVEEYATGSAWTLPTFVIGRAEEIPAVAAGHILNFDPAAVIALTVGLRAIVTDCTEALAGSSHHTTVESCDEDAAILAEGILRKLALAIGVDHA